MKEQDGIFECVTCSIACPRSWATNARPILDLRLHVRSASNRGNGEICESQDPRVPASSSIVSNCSLGALESWSLGILDGKQLAKVPTTVGVSIRNRPK